MLRHGRDRRAASIAAALGIYLLGLALAFGWRSVVQWRRTGDTGLRLDAGPAGTLRWWAKLLFVVALLLGAAGPAAALGGLPAIEVLEHPAARGAGAVLAGAGVLATLISVSCGEGLLLLVDELRRQIGTRPSPVPLALTDRTAHDGDDMLGP